MYQFLGMSGDDYCLIDHVKLLIFTVDKEELWSMVVEDGAEIRGLSREVVDLSSFKVQKASSQCNWVAGENIFLKAKSLAIDDDGRFTITAGGRHFNGIVNKDDSYAVVFCFDFGVQVPILRDDFNSLISGDIGRVIATLKSLAEPVEPDDTLEEKYFEVAGTDSEAGVVRQLVTAGMWPICRDME